MKKGEGEREGVKKENVEHRTSNVQRRRKHSEATVSGGEQISNQKSEVLNQKSLFARRLLAWFRREARVLPWRGTRDPYRIWVSEIMLQQTQVATVVAYFERFVARFPDVHVLATAPEQEVLRLWEGLGYYRRARQMHRAAGLVVSEHGGALPTSTSVLRSLPGIGRYTAGAILSIAHDAREPILEANTIRVLSRLSAYRGDPASGAGQKHLWQLAADILPARQAGHFNQALMELGATLCTPREPRCAECPVGEFCQAKLLGLQDSIPTPPRKMKYEDVTEAAVVVWKGDKVLLRQCQPGERWAGLWDFPRFAVTKNRRDALHKELTDKVRDLTGVTIVPGERLATITHGVTRFRITLHCHEAELLSPPKPFKNGELQWLTPERLSDLPLSVTGRKISRLLANGRHRTDESGLALQ